MSNIRRQNEKFYLNPNDQYENNRRKISNDRFTAQRISNIDGKVYVGNVPTDQLTDSELLDFFKPFGKVSDIRVYKGYLFVQYDRIDDAQKLIEQGQTSLILKGNKLDILPAMEINSNNRNKSSFDQLFKDNQIFQQDLTRNSRRYSDYDRHSNSYEPPRKKQFNKHNDDHQRNKSTFNYQDFRESNPIEIDDDRRVNRSLSKSCSRRLSRSPHGRPYDKSSHNNRSYCTILSGSDDLKQLVGCQIIIVNHRQRVYAEEISSHLQCAMDLKTSIVLIREDCSLTEAIENAANQQCLYGIIAMPMHEERRTASFHILYGQAEEHRNLTLEDGYQIILTNYSHYKQCLENDEINNQNNQLNICPKSNEYIHQEQQRESTLTINDKLPLSMLLCLLADGRQLTLDEIDRVLVYLLEKKAKMLTLPEGTLPPLPAIYANHQTGNSNISERKSNSIKSNELSSTIAEQICHLLSSNILKSSTDELNKNRNETLSDHIKIEDKNISQTNLHNNRVETNSNNYHKTTTTNNFISDQQKTQFCSKSTNNSVAVVTPSFYYSSSIPNNTNLSNSYNDLTQNSLLKQPISNMNSQSSESFYSSTQNIYQTLPTTAAAETAAAIFQAYSQFNQRQTSLHSIVNQQTNNQQQLQHNRL